MNTTALFDMEPSLEREHHSLWAEKYRPNILDDFIGSDVVKKSLQGFIEKQDIPHILLFGPSGTGKTSIGKLLLSSIQCDSLIINASDENGVDSIRNKVQEFSIMMGIHPLKIIFLDEMDFMTPNAQAIMRNLMETYSHQTRFILTCNYQEKLIAPIKSRCQSFEIKPPVKKICAAHLAKILTSENVKFQPQEIVFIVNSYFPDMRKIINFAQQSSINGELKISKENAIDSDYKMKLVELLKTPSKGGIFNDIRQLVADAAFSNYEEVYNFLFEHVNEFAPGKEPLVIVELADAVYQSALVFEREITFVAAMHKILKVLR